MTSLPLALTSESGATHLSHGDIERPLPSAAEEGASATVLSDKDAEVAAHEKRCEMPRAHRQAMMRELPTGRARLEGRRTTTSACIANGKRS